MIKSVGIMGVGYVGGAVLKVFEASGMPVTGYDPAKGLTDLDKVNAADAVFIAVPTPYRPDQGGFDLSFVESAIGALSGEKLIVIKSTVLPGTTEALQEKWPQHTFLMNPEFLTQATADQDMRFPDRQIVGYTKKRESFTRAGDLMAILPLAPFERIMPATAAEVVKYFNNTWFSTKVTFANQMYDLCEKLGVDYDAVREAAAADKRVGRSHLEVFHKGYRGYGGACLPKDTRALIQLGKRLGVEMALLAKVEELNDRLHRMQGIEPPA
jgi:UDPglucose 6-dehydrogenase